MGYQYKRPFWCEKGTERDVEMQFMFNHLVKIKPKNILDVGFAGSGYINMILDLGIDYTGMDNSNTRATGNDLKIPESSTTTMSKQHWKATTKKIKVLIKDICSFIAKPVYDLTMSISVIEHMVYNQYGIPREDIRAVNNMKLTTRGYLLLTFPCGLKKRLTDRDILIFDKVKIDKIVGDWNIVDEKYYICDKVFKTATKDNALNYNHTGRDVKSLCCLLLKK